MKELPSILLFLFAGMAILPAQEFRAPDTLKRNVPDLERWTEERIVRREDSVKRALYPEPAIGILPRSERRAMKPKAKTSTDAPVTFANGHVPYAHPVDMAKDVGAIPMASGTNPAGAKVYSVPLEIAPGRAGFQPQLSIVYNSLAGNGTMGVGWGIGGLSAISRTPRSKYYDNRTQGVEFKKSDAFAIDGMRLIKLSETSAQIRYETEQGQIRATAFLNGDIVRYFEVRYPDGNKAVFGHTWNYGNRPVFPITSLTDPRGNVYVPVSVQPILHQHDHLRRWFGHVPVRNGPAGPGDPLRRRMAHGEQQAAAEDFVQIGRRHVPRVRVHLPDTALPERVGTGGDRLHGIGEVPEPAAVPLRRGQHGPRVHQGGDPAVAMVHQCPARPADRGQGQVRLRNG